MIRCYAALKQYDKIEPLLTQLKDVVNQPYQLEEAYRLLVNMYNQAEKYDKALEMYLDQIKINPQNHRYNGLLNGLVNGNTNVFEDSEKAKKYMDAFNEYLKKNPKEILVQGMIAELSLWMGKVTDFK
jgi:tetratricopeptide (TPR) repeat protein